VKRDQSASRNHVSRFTGVTTQNPVEPILSTQQRPYPRSFPRREVTKQYSETSRALSLSHGLVRHSTGTTLPRLALFRRWKDTSQTPVPEILLASTALVAAPTTILMPSVQSSSDPSHCSFPKSTVHPYQQWTKLQDDTSLAERSLQTIYAAGGRQQAAGGGQHASRITHHVSHFTHHVSLICIGSFSFWVG
jgi:hypothetical protein